VNFVEIRAEILTDALPEGLEAIFVSQYDDMISSTSNLGVSLIGQVDSAPINERTLDAVVVSSAVLL